VEARNLTMYSAKSGAFNMGGLATRTSPSYYLFKNVSANMGLIDSGQNYPCDGGGRFWLLYNVSHSRWVACTFNTGTAASHVFNAGDHGWSSCYNNDFSGSTISGYCGSWSGAPTTALGYWDSGANFLANGNVAPLKL